MDDEPLAIWTDPLEMHAPGLHDIETVGGVALVKYGISNRAGDWAQG
ncbi:hypothetical protein [Dinoroseobacter shibae]